MFWSRRDFYQKSRLSRSIFSRYLSRFLYGTSSPFSNFYPNFYKIFIKLFFSSFQPNNKLIIIIFLTGLPVQVRDHALQIKEQLPKQGANRDFFIQNADRALALTDGTVPYGQLAKITDAGTNEMLRKLARNQPYYNRNLPHICSFFVKGECLRGEECPYRFFCYLLFFPYFQKNF